MDKDNERIWSVFAHLGFVFGMFIPFGSIITPAFILFLNKGKSKFVTDNARESVNFQVFATLVAIVFMFLAFGLGMLLDQRPALFITLVSVPALAFTVWYLFHCIKAVIAANNNVVYHYPTPLDLFKEQKKQEMPTGVL